MKRATTYGALPSNAAKLWSSALVADARRGDFMRHVERALREEQKWFGASVDTDVRLRACYRALRFRVSYAVENWLLDGKYRRRLLFVWRALKGEEW